MENYHIKSLTFKKYLLTVLTITLTLTGNKVSGQVLKALVPEGALAQYAGSIGYGSIGISYNFLKEDRASLDLTYGYVPESKGGKLNILTGKLSYKPVAIRLKELGTLYPVNPGVFVSYHPGKQFKKWSDEQYPKGYYWWSKAIRYHISLATEVKIKGNRILPKTGIKGVGIYSELNTNDLYAVSWFKNRDSMSFLDIVRVGYGVRIYF